VISEMKRGQAYRDTTSLCVFTLSTACEEHNTIYLAFARGILLRSMNRNILPTVLCRMQFLDPFHCSCYVILTTFQHRPWGQVLHLNDAMFLFECWYIKQTVSYLSRRVTCLNTTMKVLYRILKQLCYIYFQKTCSNFLYWCETWSQILR